MADLHLTGCMNNAPCDLVVPFEWGTYVAATQVGLHWDPLLAVLSVVGLLQRPPAESGPAWTRTVLHDDQGRETGAWVISGDLSEAGYRGQVMSGAVRFEPREQVVRFDQFQVTAMQVGYQVVATTAQKFSGGRG